MGDGTCGMGGGASGRPIGTLKLGRASLGLVRPTVGLGRPVLVLDWPTLGIGCSAELARTILRDGGGILVLGRGICGINDELFGLCGDTFERRGTLGTGRDSFGGTFALGGGGTLIIGGGTLNEWSPCPPWGDGPVCQRCQRAPHCGGGSAMLGPGGGPLYCARELGW